jgi:predicted dehydrogenase
MPYSGTVERHHERVLNVGLVGFGYASATFHAPLIQATAGLRLAAVVSSAPEKTRQSLPNVDIHDTAASMYSRADIDLVVIATPNRTHFPLAMEALRARKHVVVDKPFVLDTAEARQLVDYAGAQKLVLSVFHNRRWDGDFLTVKSLLAQETLGRVVQFESHFDRFRPVVRNRWRESDETGGGLWYDLGSHLVDQALQLFGRPTAIWLDLASQRDGALTDDWFHAVLQYGSMRALLHASALTPLPGPRFTVHGSRATYVKHGLDMQETALRAGHILRKGWADDPNAGMLTSWSEQETISRAYQTCPGNYLLYYEGLRDAILLQQPAPVTARSALEVVEVLDAGIESARCGKLVLF